MSLKKLALAAALGLALQAHAAPASPDTVDALFNLMHLDRIMDPSYLAMDRMMRSTLEQSLGKDLTPAQRRAQEAALKEMTALVHREMSWALLEPGMRDAYCKTFTQEEIEAAINFYATPAGQSMLEKTPALMQNFSGTLQARMQALIPKIQEIARKAAAAGQGQE